MAAQLLPIPTGAPHGVSEHSLPPGGTVCVTGAAGYVGGWLTKLLLEKGYTVRACVRKTDDDRKVGYLKAMPEYGGRLTLHSADMTVEGAYDAVFPGCSVVFHPAEVFMSFAGGRDAKAAASDFAAASGLDVAGSGGLGKAAMSSNQFIVDSINKSGTVRRLIYTSSVASMSGVDAAVDPVVNETQLPDSGMQGYGIMKRLMEKFFDFQAQSSGGRWDVVTGNPGSLFGPIQSPHHAAETWQGKIASVLRGEPLPQDANGRPWFLADVRDVAAFEIALAEADVFPGARFLLASGDRCPPHELGARAMELHPEWDCASIMAPAPGAEGLAISPPHWMRVSLDSRKVRAATGLNFRSFEDSFRDTVDSLVAIGGVQPKLK